MKHQKMNGEQFVSRHEFENTMRELRSERDSDLFTQRRAAAYLRCCVVTFRKICREAHIPSVSVGRRLLFKKADLDSYINLYKREVQTNDSQVRELLDYSGAARYLRTSIIAISDLVDQGLLKPYSAGRNRIFFLKHDLERFDSKKLM